MSCNASWHGVPATFIPDSERERARCDLPKAISWLQKQLTPGDPQAILTALHLMAERRGLALPNAQALEIDIEIMAEWPSDLFRQAYKTIWTRFAYRRMPEVADFYQVIGEELQDRQKQLSTLSCLARKLGLRVAHEG